jgi:hypothetical protein
VRVTAEEAFRRQGQVCRDLGYPFSAHLLEACAADLAAGGVVSRVVSPDQQLRIGDLIPLRLLGGVHRLVLQRKAPKLALHFPSVGGDADPFAAWPAFREAVDEHRDELATGLSLPPQTNEPARAALLAGALIRVEHRYRLPVRLFELGASAGLNLRVDAFRFTAGAMSIGSPEAQLVMDPQWVGPGAPSGEMPLVVERAGVDLSPIDPTTTEGRLRLTSFVWPDDAGRFERLRGALATAERVPARVDQGDMLAFVEGIEPRDGAVTVVWHSVALMYVQRAHRDRVHQAIESLGARASARGPVVCVGFEPDDPSGLQFPLRMRWWPEGIDEVVALAPPHATGSHWF